MKSQLLKMFYGLSMFALFITGCKKEEDMVYANPQGSFSLKSNYTTPLVLLQANQDDTIMK